MIKREKVGGFMRKACAITGHHPRRFKWKYSETNNGFKRLRRRMQEQLILLYEQGYREFWIDGNPGVGMWAGELLLQLREQPEYREIRLMTALTFDGFDGNWDARSKRRLSDLVRNSAEAITVCRQKGNPVVCYKRRNYYMVDHADCLLAVYDNDPSVRSITSAMVNYARKRERQIILIHPDTAKVSVEGQSVSGAKKIMK